LAFGSIIPLTAQNQPPVYRVDVQLVRATVTVKDQKGSPAGNLTKQDFSIFDNGARQEIALFERHTQQPLSISLLVDNSGSTAKDLRYEVESMQRFLKAVFAEGNMDDAVSLYSFNYEVVIQNGFTRRLAVLERNLKALKGEAGTSLYDAIYFASGRLEDREGRHVMVIVTDGGDTTSRKTYHQALEAAQRADAVLYAILVMPITNDAGRNIGGENALTTLTASTGGRVFTPSGSKEVDTAFSEILTDLRTQYLIGYYPKNVPPGKSRFHRLEVKVERNDLRAITRNGYYGDAEEPRVESDRPARPRVK
jgi:Ca-activated chloride channel family protein